MSTLASTALRLRDRLDAVCGVVENQSTFYGSPTVARQLDLSTGTATTRPMSPGQTPHVHTEEEIETRVWDSSLRALESVVQVLTTDMSIMRRDLEKEKASRARAERQLQLHIDSIAKQGDDRWHKVITNTNESQGKLSALTDRVALLPTATDVLYWTNKMADIGEAVGSLLDHQGAVKQSQKPTKETESVDIDAVQLRQMLKRDVREMAAKEFSSLRHTLESDMERMKSDMQRYVSVQNESNGAKMLADLRAEMSLSIADGIEEVRKSKFDIGSSKTRPPIPKSRHEVESHPVVIQEEAPVAVQEIVEQPSNEEEVVEQPSNEEEVVDQPSNEEEQQIQTEDGTRRKRPQRTFGHQRRTTRPEDVILMEVEHAFAKTISPCSVERVKRSLSHIASPLGMATAVAVMDAVVDGVGIGVGEEVVEKEEIVEEEEEEKEVIADDTRRCSLNAPAPAPDEILDWEDDHDLNNRLSSGIELFNVNARDGIENMVAHNMLHPSPLEVARFLRYCDGLDKTQIGEYIGKRNDYNINVLEHYVCTLDFAGMAIVDALRKFLNLFRLPGESQMIDRIIQKFALHYHDANPNGPFADSDAVYVLGFSIIMLNTDAHNPRIKKKDRMTRKQFIKNNRGINGGGDVDSSTLSSIYNEIIKHEIKLDMSTPKNVK